MYKDVIDIIIGYKNLINHPKSRVDKRPDDIPSEIWGNSITFQSLLDIIPKDELCNKLNKSIKYELNIPIRIVYSGSTMIAIDIFRNEKDLEKCKPIDRWTIVHQFGRVASHSILHSLTHDGIISRRFMDTKYKSIIKDLTHSIIEVIPCNYKTNDLTIDRINTTLNENYIISKYFNSGVEISRCRYIHFNTSFSYLRKVSAKVLEITYTHKFDVANIFGNQDGPISECFITIIEKIQYKIDNNTLHIISTTIK